MKIRVVSWIGTTALVLTTVAPLPLWAAPEPSPVSTPTPTPIVLDQGSNWTPSDRKEFYGRDQGSQIMPLKWIRALKQANGEPFMAASLSRYGYLPNEASDPPGLPIGFTVASGSGVGQIGMTCSACHTRQIDVAGASYRIDGGPAIVDTQSLFADLDTAVSTVLTNQMAFTDFAAAVLGSKPPPDEKTKLRQAVTAWYLRYHTLMKKALPKPPWGPARLDAVGMIFNRVTGLDIGPPPSYLIPENIEPASAPVRFPFLWDAPAQDQTQWPGFAANGSNLLGLARNLGEVFGVFAVFQPKKGWLPHEIDYLANNSANFSGLNALEELARKIGPPKWPWSVDQSLASQGKEIFARPTERDSCISCHGIKPGKTRFPDFQTWATPVMDVETDSREYRVLGRTVKTGVLSGARVFLPTDRLQPTDTAIRVLETSVLGSILQHSLRIDLKAEGPLGFGGIPSSLPTVGIDSLKDAFDLPGLRQGPAPSPPPAYEARVLEGIWAAAPYLHNGSVPTLAELLKPANERVSSFKIGPAYDTVNIGLAVEQTKFNFVLQTTDCSDRDSGNSRCGHEYGTKLSPDEKKALLEYLKTL